MKLNRSFLWLTALLVAGAALAAPAVNQKAIYWRTLTGQGTSLTIKQMTTTAATKILDLQDDGGTTVFSVTREGDTLLGSTGTGAASSGAATVSKQTGVVTSEALTTAAGSAYTLTLTNTLIAATSRMFVSFANGSNTQGTLSLGEVTPGTGSATIVIRNIHATQALNGTIKITFLVIG